MAISGPLSGPSGSPRSPAEPHPPSLAWVETPLPLGPLPPPPGPLNAKHSKRARGAVFNGTHSPVRYSQSSPIRAELDTARVSTARRRPSHRARTSRPVPAAHDKFSAVGAKPRAVPLAKSPPNFRPTAEVGAEGGDRPNPTPPSTASPSLIALTMRRRMGHRGRGTNRAKPRAGRNACERHTRRVRHTPTHKSIAHEEVLAAILADEALIVEGRIRAPCRRRACEYIRAADGLTNCKAGVMRLDGVHAGDSSRPSAVPTYDFWVDLHHGCQRGCTRAHADARPTVRLLDAQSKQPET